jgi:hypothetical protein
MKKYIVITATLLTCLATTGKAQEVIDDERKKIIFGAKAGANVSNVYDASGENFVADPKVGFAGGAFLCLPIGKYIGLQPELLFSQKGYQSTGTIGGVPYSDKRTTSYLDIPLQIQFKPAEFITFLGGVQYSYLMHQQDAYVFNGNFTAQDQAFKNDNPRKNIFGAVYGIDVNINHFVISGKACWDLMANQGNGTSTTPRYKNIWFQLTVGFRLYR